MTNLCEQLCLPGRVCFMGLGNVDYGDDGFGVRLAERLARAGTPDVLIVGTTPERFLSQVADQGFDHVIFLDAVEFGEAAGSVVVLNAAQMDARYPQISTHKLSLGLLAQWIESAGDTKAWLLGVQPESLKGGDRLTATVQRTLDLLAGLLSDKLSVPMAHPTAGGRNEAFA